MSLRKKRIVIGKIGLDSHDNGIRIVSKWYMDHGYEVIYAGLYNTSERILQIAIEESADALGVSFLGAEHLHYGRELSGLIKVKELNDLKLIIGGVIPPEDVKELADMGFHAVFTPGTRRKTILDTTDRILNS
jgi:methylmalonyl-CoA mutase C-terminal domain/subunit